MTRLVVIAAQQVLLLQAAKDLTVLLQTEADSTVTLQEAEMEVQAAAQVLQTAELVVHRVHQEVQAVKITTLDHQIQALVTLRVET